MSETVAKSFTLEPYDYGEARALIDGLGLAEPVAVTLVRRGYRTVEQARAFLDADDDHDPFLFEAMAEVCERIRGAIAAGRPITVHGDYDVDGVCSTAIVVGAVRALGGECDWLIPGRQEDGYGFTAATVERLAARGTSLLVTTDCGICSAEEVDAAHRGRDRGDRHRPPPARRAASSVPDPASGARRLPVRRALRHRRRLQARRRPAGRGGGGARISTSSLWRR